MEIKTENSYKKLSQEIKELVDTGLVAVAGLETTVGFINKENSLFYFGNNTLRLKSDAIGKAFNRVYGKSFNWRNFQFLIEDSIGYIEINYNMMTTIRDLYSIVYSFYSLSEQTEAEKIEVIVLYGQIIVDFLTNFNSRIFNFSSKIISDTLTTKLGDVQIDIWLKDLIENFSQFDRYTMELINLWQPISTDGSIVLKCDIHTHELTILKLDNNSELKPSEILSIALRNSLSQGNQSNSKTLIKSTLLNFTPLFVNFANQLAYSQQKINEYQSENYIREEQLKSWVKVFNDQAIEKRRGQMLWLGFGILTSVGYIWFVICNFREYFHINEALLKDPNFGWIDYLVLYTPFLVISYLIITLVNICYRKFAANNRFANVFEQKAKYLDIFNILRARTKDDNTIDKSALLQLIALQAIKAEDMGKTWKDYELSNLINPIIDRINKPKN